jgi:hypothetical protein
MAPVEEIITTLATVFLEIVAIKTGFVGQPYGIVERDGKLHACFPPFHSISCSIS